MFSISAGLRLVLKAPDWLYPMNEHHLWTTLNVINYLIDLIICPPADLPENEKLSHVEELMYQRSKLKKKMLGNINFIGELFNLGMLSSKIIISQVRPLFV